MMTQSQKKFFEWPLLLLSMLVLQVLEVGFLHLPVLGSLQITPILIIYITLSRGWGKLAGLSFLFASLASTWVAYPAPVFIGVQVWTALVTKAVVYGLALEGRNPFVFLVAGSNVFYRVLAWVLLRGASEALPFWDMLLHTFLTSLSSALLAWLLFPVFIWWDEYFEHEAEDARELNPNVLR